MTIDDFKTKTKSYRRYEIASGCFLMFGLMLGAFLGSFLEDRVNSVGFDIVCIIITLVSLPFIAAVIFYGISRFLKKCLRQLGLLCPTCHKALVGTAGAKKKLHVVVTTGRCGFCGGQVLSSETAPPNTALEPAQ
jgi:hypothetical protein